MTIIPKIKYKLYGTNKTGNTEVLNTENYYPIPATPEFDSYLEAKAFYDDTVALNQNFYRTDSENGFFKKIVIMKTISLLPHKNGTGSSYSIDEYTYNEANLNLGLRTMPSNNTDDEI